MAIKCIWLFIIGSPKQVCLRRLSIFDILSVMSLIDGFTVEDLLGRLLDQSPDDDANVCCHQMHHPELGNNLK